MRSTERFKRLYDFLVDHEASGRTFTMKELADELEYTVSSLRTNYSKKLKNYLVYESGDDGLISDGVSSEFTRSVFVEYMSQVSAEVKKSEEDRLVGYLE